MSKQTSFLESTRKKTFIYKFEDIDSYGIYTEHVLHMRKYQFFCFYHMDDDGVGF